MRFMLFKLTIERTSDLNTGYVVAPESYSANEVVQEMVPLRDGEQFTLERIDETLPADQRIGLDEMLQTAPVGLASFCLGIGWIAHAMPVPKLKLFIIEIEDDDQPYFVAAPMPEVACSMFFETVPLAPPGQVQTFSIHEAAGKVTDQMRAGIEAFLEFCPISMVVWDPEHGWMRT